MRSRKGKPATRGTAIDITPDVNQSSKEDETGSAKNQSGKDPPETSVSDRARASQQGDALEDRSPTFPKEPYTAKRMDKRPTVETEDEATGEIVR
jgi:hypothetical protein